MPQQLLIDTNGLDMWGGSAGGLFNTKVLDVVEMCRGLGLGKHALEGGKTGWTMAERIALIEKSCRVFLQSCALLLFVLDKRMPPWPAEGASLEKWEAYFKVGCKIFFMRMTLFLCMFMCTQPEITTDIPTTFNSNSRVSLPLHSRC